MARRVFYSRLRFSAGGRHLPTAVVLLILFVGCAGSARTAVPSSSGAPSLSPSVSPSAPASTAPASSASAAAQSLAPELAQRWLAFSRGEQEVLSEIFVARADGSELRQLTHAGEFRINPVWSPDGTKILYRADRTIGSDIDLQRDGTWMINADGSNDHSLTAISGLAGGGVSQPWAPDGSHVLMSASKTSAPQIWVLRSDGTEAKALTPPEREAQYPAWSPDGSHIAFSMAENGSFRVYLMNADGSDMRPISDGPMDNWPMWSPDGSHLAFGRGGGLALMNADGSNVKELIPEQVGGVPASWAPGDLLVFNCSLGGNAIGICARASNGDLIPLLGGLDAGFPSWKN